MEEERFKTQLLISTIWWKLLCKRTVVSGNEPGNVSLMVHEGTQVLLETFTFEDWHTLRSWHGSSSFGFNSSSWK